MYGGLFHSNQFRCNQSTPVRNIDSPKKIHRIRSELLSSSKIVAPDRILLHNGPRRDITFVDLLESALIERVLLFTQVLSFLVATTVAAISSDFAIYLRAHKQEPLTLVYLSTSLAVIVQAVILAYFTGSQGVIGGYTVIVIPLAMTLGIPGV